MPTTTSRPNVRSRSWTRRVLLGLAAGVVAVPLLAPAGAAAQARPREVIHVLTAPFGTGTFALWAAVERLMAEQHPWLQLVSTETPGWVFNGVEAENEKRWKHTVYTNSPAALWVARLGERPFPKKVDTRRLRALASYYVTVGFMTSLDEKFARPGEVPNAKAGLGRKTQTHWGVFPVYMFEGMGVAPGRIDYLGPLESMRAMLDGSVDMMKIATYFDAGLKTHVPAPPLRELEASGRTLHYLGFGADAVRFVNQKYDAPFLTITLPPGTLPQQTQSVTGYGDVPSIFVDQSFSEETAYEIVKFLLKIHPELPKYHALGKLFTPETMVFAFKDRPGQLHPGAVRAYREAGLLP